MDKTPPRNELTEDGHSGAFESEANNLLRESLTTNDQPKVCSVKFHEPVIIPEISGPVTELNLFTRMLCNMHSYVRWRFHPEQVSYDHDLQISYVNSDIKFNKKSETRAIADLNTKLIIEFLRALNPLGLLLEKDDY